MTTVLRLSNILLCLIPIVLLTGPFLPDLFLSLICLLFLVTISREKINLYFKNNFFYFFLSFNIFLIIISLFSENILYSLESSLFYFRFSLFGFVVWYLIDQNNNLIKYFFYALLIAYAYALLDGYFQYFVKSTITGIEISQFRLSLPFNDKLILGGYLSRLFPLLIGLYIYCINQNLRSYLILALLFILSDVLIFVTGERTALGLITLSTIMIIFLISDFRILRIATFLVSILFIVIITFSNRQIKQRNIDLTMTQIGVNENSEELKIFSKEHDSLIKTALNMFLEKPLHGHGPNSFRNLCDKDEYKHNELSCSTHPHHNHIQLLAETGIIGLLYSLFFFLFIIFDLTKCLFFQYFRNQKIFNNTQICIYIALLLTIWPLFPTLNFFNNWINVIYHIPLGFLLYFRYSNLNKSNSNFI